MDSRRVRTDRGVVFSRQTYTREVTEGTRGYTGPLLESDVYQGTGPGTGSPGVGDSSGPRSREATLRIQSRSESESFHPYALRPFRSQQYRFGTWVRQKGGGTLGESCPDPV